MGRHSGCYFASVAGAFALGVLLMYFCSLKVALFISAVLLFLVCHMFLSWH